MTMAVADMAIPPRDMLELALSKLDQVLVGQRNLEIRLSTIERQMEDRRKRDSRKESEASLDVLNSYLVQNNVSSGVADKIRAEFGRQPAPNLKMEEVEAFNHMNVNVLNELNLELRKKWVQLHPMMQMLKQNNLEDEAFLDKMCLSGRTITVAKGRVVFTGQPAGLKTFDQLSLPALCPEDCMAFIASGALNVKDCQTGDIYSSLTPGQWVSEASVWSSNWRRVTTVEAAEECELILINGSIMAELVLRLPDELQKLVSRYALGFMEVVLTKQPDTPELPFADMQLFQACAQGKITSGTRRGIAQSYLRETFRSPIFETMVGQNNFFAGLKKPW